MATLVLCYDGTWNNMEQEDNGNIAPTNVVKFYHSLRDNDSAGNPIKKFYHPGLGGEEIGLKAKIVDGALGASIGNHISTGYKWISDNFQTGDHICILGFSRGAFTARSLAGLLKAGVMDTSELSVAQTWKQIKSLYTLYTKKKLHDAPTEWFVNNSGEVQFLGVWDTVGALGVPNEFGLLNIFDNKKKWQFHNTALGEHVKVARHAMAMDEVRSSFTVTQWSNAAAHPNAKQIWFPGVHSDVGGGYENCDLSDLALAWMIEEASTAEANLQFRNEVAVTGNANGTLHNSYKGIFAKMRSRPRNVPEVSPANSHLFHPAVFARQANNPIKYGPYWPTTHLEIGEFKEIEIFAKHKWNAMDLYFSQGEEYEFSSSGEWVDKTDSCDWRGAERDDYTIGDAVRSVASFFGKFEGLFNSATKNKEYDIPFTKRLERIDWFAAVGCVANDSGVKSAAGNDGSPTPHKYFSMSAYQQNKPFKVNSSGYLYAFANDGWAFYDNNKGSVLITVKRVA